MEQDQLMKGFHRLTREERLHRVQLLAGLSDEELSLLSGDRKVSTEIAEHLIENVVGYFPIPMGVAPYFRVDGKDILVPMAVEETSIIAAAAASAKWVRKEGSIRTWTEGRFIIGQIQIPGVKEITKVREQIQRSRKILIERANLLIPSLVQRGGGVQDLSVREVEAHSQEPMLVVHVHLDPCDAMGANLINQICEALKPEIEKLTGEKVGLCILSNLMDGRLSVAEVVVRNVDPEVGKGIENASRFAEADPYRACTHNKGILNGVDAVLIATGNDWRAVEAGAHAYAARMGVYRPLSTWRMRGPDLMGRLEMPLAVGTVGGMTRLHPMARISMKLLKVEKAEDLARVCAAVGLIQNLGALKALATVGIVKGHMQLHATNLAIAAGADLHEVSQVRERLAEVLRIEKRINVSRAKEILENLRSEGSPSILQ